MELGLPAVDDEGCAGRDALLDVADDPVASGSRDDRAHVAALRAVAGLERSHPLGDLGDELVGDGVDGNERGDGHAPLARRAEARVDRGVGSKVKVGVGQHEHVVLGATKGLDTLARLRAALVDVLRDRGRADEGDRGDPRVVEDRVDRFLVTVDDVHDAVGQARLAPQLCHGVDGRGVLLGGLDDDGVAAGDGYRHEPHRHHGREVERRDDTDNTEWLEDRVGVDAVGDVFGEATLEQVRDTAGELDDLQATGDLTEGVRGDLAVLSGDEGGNALLVVVEQLAEGEEHLGAAGERGLAPLLGGGGCLGHDIPDDRGAGEVDLSRHLAGGRVEDVSGALRGALPRGVPDQVGDATGRAHQEAPERST